MREELAVLVFFGVVAALLALVSLLVAIPVFVEFAAMGSVKSVPSAVLAASLMILAALSVFAGFVLDSVTRARWETKRLHYLALPPPGGR